MVLSLFIAFFSFHCNKVLKLATIKQNVNYTSDSPILNLAILKCLYMFLSTARTASTNFRFALQIAKTIMSQY